MLSQSDLVLYDELTDDVDRSLVKHKATRSHWASSCSI
jgi:hypothetical protein